MIYWSMRDMLYNWPGHEQSEWHIMLSLIIAESKHFYERLNHIAPSGKKQILFPPGLSFY